MAGVVEKRIGARVLELGLFCKEHNFIHCDNGALHPTPVLQFSSYTTPQSILELRNTKFVSSPESSPESSPIQSPAFA